MAEVPGRYRARGTTRFRESVAILSGLLACSLVLPRCPCKSGTSATVAGGHQAKVHFFKTGKGTIAQLITPAQGLTLMGVEGVHLLQYHH